MESDKTGKQIVSKGKYVANVGSKYALLALGVGVSLLSVFMALYFCIMFGPKMMRIRLFTIHSNEGVFIAAIIAVLFMGMVVLGTTVLVFSMGTFFIKEAKLKDTGVPFTRSNTADLPAPDSLVRAVSEPMQCQEDTLLRAAAHGVETPSEQLIRPV